MRRRVVILNSNTETDAESEKILAHADGAIGWITVNQPAKRNAISLAMAARATEVIKQFSEDDSVRVIILTGSGDTAFVSGADISEFEDKRNDAAAAADYHMKSSRMYRAVREIEKPTIAMIHGYCMGGGVALAASCDLRFCSEDAVFAIPAARLGLGYRRYMVELVLNLIGPAYTKEMLFTGNQFTGVEAASMGLVNRVVLKSELESFVGQIATTIAGNAPLSVKASKVIIEELLKDSGARDLERCERLVQECADSKDYVSGRQAFMKKSRPVFTGG